MSGDEPSTVVAGQQDPGEPLQGRQSRLALRLAWHRDIQRIGSVGVLAGERSEISRKSPPFDIAKDVVLSRDPFLTVLDHGGSIEIQPTEARTPIQVNGQSLTRPLRIADDEISTGIIIVLAHEIVVCLHRLEVPVQRGPTLGLIGTAMPWRASGAAS